MLIQGVIITIKICDKFTKCDCLIDQQNVLHNLVLSVCIYGIKKELHNRVHQGNKINNRTKTFYSSWP